MDCNIWKDIERCITGCEERTTDAVHILPVPDTMTESEPNLELSLAVPGANRRGGFIATFCLQVAAHDPTARQQSLRCTILSIGDQASLIPFRSQEVVASETYAVLVADQTPDTRDATAFPKISRRSPTMARKTPRLEGL